MKKITKSISVYILLFIALALLVTYFSSQPMKEVPFSQFVAELREGKFDTLIIEDMRVVGKVKADKADIGDKESNRTTIFANVPSMGVLYEHAGEDIKAKVNSGELKLVSTPPQTMPLWMSILPSLLIIVALVVVWFFFLQQQQGGGGKAMSFGKSRAKLMNENQKKIGFASVAGADEEKEELQEIVEFLRAPKKYTDLGARIPKGVLMVGPPGTGKTLLAKAVAGEAGVPFFSISGSDFVEMFVGVGASRVRDLFEQAKKNAPCIVFIDEIDAVGRHRGAGLGGGHDEREQTLNQLLVEMDGFGLNEGVIIVAATNRPDILDPALLRPGRFDRQIVVHAPDVRGREDILKVHSKDKPLSKDVDLKVIAKTTPGFTGADLENLMNESALLTARRNKTAIGMPEVEDAMIKVIAGPEKKTRIISDNEKRLTAYHEAGHALIAKLLPNRDPVHQVSIIPRGRAGGYTLSLPKEDKSYVSKQEMLDDIVSLLGGRVAEKIVLDDISTGASNDIERLTAIARKMVTKYGMSDALGPISYGSGHEEVFLGKEFSQSKNYSDSVAAQIDAEVSKIIDTAYSRCHKLLEDNIDKLHKIATVLIEKEKLDALQFEELFAELNKQPVTEQE